MIAPAMSKNASRQGKNPRAKSPSALTHFDARGSAHMVDVGEKAATRRVAVASGRISMKPATFRGVAGGGGKKGDVLGVPRVAAMLAAKGTPGLIPMADPIPMCRVTTDLRPKKGTAS